MLTQCCKGCGEVYAILEGEAHAIAQEAHLLVLENLCIVKKYRIKIHIEEIK